MGVDIGEDEIETASRWADQNRPSFSYILGRVEDLDLPAEWADITIISEVLEHVPELETREMLEAAIALTNRNGRILITVPNIHQLRNRARRSYAADQCSWTRTTTGSTPSSRRGRQSAMWASR